MLLQKLLYSYASSQCEDTIHTDTPVVDSGAHRGRCRLGVMKISFIFETANIKDLKLNGYKHVWRKRNLNLSLGRR
jgi:hypothetical protein